MMLELGISETWKCWFMRCHRDLLCNWVSHPGGVEGSLYAYSCRQDLITAFVLGRSFPPLSQSLYGGSVDLCMMF